MEQARGRPGVRRKRKKKGIRKARLAGDTDGVRAFFLV